MRCKLSIHNTDPKVDIIPFEHMMTGDSLTLGRSKTNDIPLDDPHRLISSRHAEIRHRNLEWHVIDVGSTNGTLLNGTPLEGKKEYRLKAKDEIQIGKFCIQCDPQLDTTPADSLVDHHPAPRSLPAFPSRLERITASLALTYREQRELSELDRQPLLVECVRKALQGLDDQEAQQFLASIESHFSGASTPLSPKGQPLAPPTPISTPTPAPPIPEFAGVGIEALLKDYIEPERSPLSAEEQAALSLRLRKFLEMFFDFLHKSLQGRRQVEQEFEAEVTRIFSRERNPIKEARSGTALGHYLFQNHDSTNEADMSSHHLQQALNDLSLHHMGMMAGFRESLHGLLMQLDPATLEQEAQQTPLKIGSFSIPGKLGPFAGLRNWSYFKQKHHKFLDEEVKTFESILGPHFSKGYLRVHDR